MKGFQRKEKISSRFWVSSPDLPCRFRILPCQQNWQWRSEAMWMDSKLISIVTFLEVYGGFISMMQICYLRVQSRGKSYTEFDSAAIHIGSSPVKTDDKEKVSPKRRTFFLVKVLSWFKRIKVIKTDYYFCGMWPILGPREALGSQEWDFSIRDVKGEKCGVRCGGLARVATSWLGSARGPVEWVESLNPPIVPPFPGVF